MEVSNLLYVLLFYLYIGLRILFGYLFIFFHFTNTKKRNDIVYFHGDKFFYYF